MTFLKNIESKGGGGRYGQLAKKQPRKTVGLLVQTRTTSEYNIVASVIMIICTS